MWDRNRTKLLKGPWTHCPDTKSLLFVLERCSACCMLIDRVSHVIRVLLYVVEVYALATSSHENGYCVHMSELTCRQTWGRQQIRNRSFVLMMQTGAFLQLVLTLAAIASRMSLLLTEIRAALEVSWSASHAALQTVNVRSFFTRYNAARLTGPSPRKRRR